MQQRIDLRWRREIVAAGGAEVIVRNHRRGRGPRLRQLAALLRQQRKQHRDDHGDDGHEQQRRQDAEHPPRVEIGRREAPGQQLAGDLMRDQEAGDDEEHVDADKAAAEAWNVSVKADHREDRDGPHAVDIGEPPPGRENPCGLGSAVGRCCCYRLRGHAAWRCDFQRRYQRIVRRRRGGRRVNGVAACYQRTKDAV